MDRDQYRSSSHNDVKETLPEIYKCTPTMVKQHSRLLNLPAELRNTVWSLILTAKTIEIRVKNNLVRPPLLKVCQRITSDATRLYYSANTFRITFQPWDLTVPSLWLGSIVGPTNAAAISDLQIQLAWTAAKRQASRFKSQKYEDVRDELDEHARQNLHAFARELFGRGIDLKMVRVTVNEVARDSEQDDQPIWMTQFSHDMGEALDDATAYLIERRTECSLLTQEYMSQTH